jgi:carotenoid 1,2-hydratase
MNVALYGPRMHRWAMTERTVAAVERTPTSFQVGPSGLSWNGQCLTLELDELTPPFPLPPRWPIKGRVRVWPETFTARAFELDGNARHIWWPIAPMARIEVELVTPALRWSGHGYIDHNRGTEPLEQGFRQWDWSRAPLGRDAVVLYDCDSRSDPVEPMAIRFDPSGECEPIDLPATTRLLPTRWLVPRKTRTDAGGSARVIKTLEDTPFYARSLVESLVGGSRVPTVHESLSLDRFASPVVQWMLPYKMPRIATQS